MTRLLAVVLGLVTALAGVASAATDWYPIPEPFAEGDLKVSDLHTIHYELCGNRQGQPVMVLHGGPGGGSYPDLRRFHDPQKWLIVLHDQRGAGKSTPFGEVRENTTAALVEDMERLRTHLGLEKVALFGGSWGSTLALAYAEAHPERVTSIVLRGGLHLPSLGGRPSLPRGSRAVLPRRLRGPARGHPPPRGPHLAAPAPRPHHQRGRHRPRPRGDGWGVLRDQNFSGRHDRG